MLRTGKVTKVLGGDMVELDNGAAIVRYCNVWAPEVTDPLGEEMRAYNEALVLGKTIEWKPIGYLHYDNISLICEVYLDGAWINQHLRYWLNERLPKFTPIFDPAQEAQASP